MVCKKQKKRITKQSEKNTIKEKNLKKKMTKEGMINNLSGFWNNIEDIIRSKPNEIVIEDKGQTWYFESPTIINKSKNSILGRITRESSISNIERLRKTSANAPELSGFTSLHSYALKWNPKEKTFDGKIIDNNDTSVYDVVYDGRKISGIFYETSNQISQISSLGLGNGHVGIVTMTKIRNQGSIKPPKTYDEIYNSLKKLEKKE